MAPSSHRFSCLGRRGAGQTPQGSVPCVAHELPIAGARSPLDDRPPCFVLMRMRPVAPPPPPPVFGKAAPGSPSYAPGWPSAAELSPPYSPAGPAAPEPSPPLLDGVVVSTPPLATLPSSPARAP